MKNAALWAPTKFELRDGRWRATKNTEHLLLSSRLVADLQVRSYCSLIDKHAKGDLLDLGCGVVPLYGAYRDRVATTTCADWPHSPHSDRYLDLHVDITKPLPLENESFDTVILTDVLEHIPTPDDVMAEVARLLRPNGVVIGGVPFMYGIHEAPYDFHRYTEFRLADMHQRAGLETESIAAYGNAFHCLADLLGKRVAHRPGGRIFTRALIAAGGQREVDPHNLIPTGYAFAARKPPSVIHS